MITLDTPRLHLRPFRPDDFEAYAAMCADTEVMRYVGERGVLDREDAWRQMAKRPSAGSAGSGSSA